MWNMRPQKMLVLGLVALNAVIATVLADAVARGLESNYVALQPAVNTGPFPRLPVGRLPHGSSYAGPRLQGAYGVLSLNTKSGRTTWNESMMFDDPSNPVVPYNPATKMGGYNASMPYIPAIQGQGGAKTDGSVITVAP